MLHKEYSFQIKIQELGEREKELKCLYRLEQIIDSGLSVKDFMMQVVERLQMGWQYPEICRIKITFEEEIYAEPGWKETEWKQQADIVIDDKNSGKIEVFYIQPRKLIIDSPFLPEEQKLLNTIANRIGNYIFVRRLKNTVKLLTHENKTVHKHEVLSGQPDTHWMWRMHMAKKIAEKLDFDRFGVKGLYIIGSTKNAIAGPASDIDLLIHIEESSTSVNDLTIWLEGWSFCLSEINFQRTGYKSEGLIDVHIVTDEDIKNRTSYGCMIGALENGAKVIKLKSFNL